ncbi:MAG: gliding motility lipoprotein GldD [Paludibacteraceae bacterium]|jgi:gliding motility-associated lipoprotein GldD|nr:gliding motility lipoprotein GldD [Paludibacteraceae bacterium]MBR6105639.1 gliding motility lipoprotein GldD [Paludibacteraceae bacterium]
MRRKKGILALALLASITLLGSCDHYQPRPRGYFRIDLPKKSYTTFNNKKYPFTFEIADSSLCLVVEKAERANDKYGFNIAYPQLHSTIYCDYKPVTDNFRDISEDCRNFVYKHVAKADAITEQPYEDSEKKVYGIMYEIKGNAASQIQFVLTDSSKHYFRGALYFHATPNADSLAPVTDYMKEDIVHMIETFNWTR